MSREIIKDVKDQAQAQHTDAQAKLAKTNFTANQGYVKRSIGYPVEVGQTWHDLTPEQRKEWFRNHESRWKSRFGIENRGLDANMSWTRG